MHCITCGTALPAEVAGCPSCGTSTPYNVTEAGDRKPQGAGELTPLRNYNVTEASTSNDATPGTVERTVLQHEPQPGIPATPGNVERTVLQQQPQPGIPATPGNVERTVLQQQPQPWMPQPFPGQQRPFPGQQQVPQPAAPPATPAWQQPQPFPIWQQPQPFLAQQVFQPTTPTPAAQSLPPQQETQRRGRSLAMILSLLIVALLIIGGSGLIYYALVGHPAALHAQATAVAQDFLTAQTPQHIYAQTTSSRPAINDPLSKPSSIWNESGSIGNGCTFTNGAYHLTVSGSTFVTACFARTNDLSDFAFQVQMTITQGLGGGLLLRADSTQSSSYIFFISPNGFYRFSLLGGTNRGKILNFSASSAIKTALNQQNLLTAIAHGSTIYLYINKQYVTSVRDSTLKSGGIGLIAEGGPNLSGDVGFSNAQVWK